jgi:hypothetical protein
MLLGRVQETNRPLSRRRVKETNHPLSRRIGLHPARIELYLHVVLGPSLYADTSQIRYRRCIEKYQDLLYLSFSSILPGTSIGGVSGYQSMGYISDTVS